MSTNAPKIVKSIKGFLTHLDQNTAEMVFDDNAPGEVYSMPAHYFIEIQLAEGCDFWFDTIDEGDGKIRARIRRSDD